MFRLLNILPLIILVLSTMHVVISEKDDPNFFKDVPTEMRCSGCLMTIKALTGMLLSSKNENLESRVSKSIDNVCEEKRLSISEYNPKVVLRVCKFIKRKHRQELTKELLRHFSQLSHSSHLPVAHHICQTVLRICPGPPIYPDNDEEAWLHIEEKTQDLKVKPGKNMRIPRPIPEKYHEEL